MKKFIQILVVSLCLFPVALSAKSSDSKKFTKQYAGQDGYTVVSVNKAAFRIISFFAKFSNDIDQAERNILSGITGVHIVSSDKNRGSFYQEALDFCKDNRYEELLEVVDKNDTVNILCQTSEEGISGFIILNRSKTDNEVNMVCVDGKFSLEDAQSLIKSNGKNIAGI